MQNASTILLIFIIDFLFDMTPATHGHKCSDNPDLWEMLLPCPKSLWTASTQFEWERNYTLQRVKQKRINRQGPTFGDMLRHNADSHSENLVDDWLADMDEFGTLVMAAANVAGIGDADESYITIPSESRSAMSSWH